jgi:RsiW-degrading membrane proteinase PrsW (M82 family)
MDNPIILYIISGILAFIPAAIWLSIIFQRTKRRGIQILIFVGSIFSVVPVFLLQYFLELFPQFDVLKFLNSNFQDQNLHMIFLFISVGIVEEIVKQFLLRFIDRKYLLIQTINESIQYSLVAALGFAFAENIFYIYSIYSQFGIKQLFITYLFRAVFTTCAHMIFSGFFGYYYGIAKFSLNIVDQSKWLGKKQRITKFTGNLLKISNYEAYKKLTVLKGLFIAILLHATFNLLLQFNQIIIVAIFVLCSYFLLRKLLNQKSGRLILIADQDNQNRSTMANKDEEVVIELLGLWFKEKKFVDVIHICQRLLERDPGNKVVMLFKAQAADKLSNNDIYGKLLKTLFPTNEEKSLAKLMKEHPAEKQQKVASPEPTNIESAPSLQKKEEEEKVFKLNL